MNSKFEPEKPMIRARAVGDARVSCKRHVLWTLNGEQNMKDTMKLEWKRHTPEMANRKVTHAVETT